MTLQLVMFFPMQLKVYLQERISDPNLKADTETAIAAWLGHAWQYTELQAAGDGLAATQRTN